MIEAAEAAGFERVELLLEPVAAVCAAPLRTHGLALVYDLGAGSFDAALVRAGPDPQLIASATMETAGGRDIDALLAERVHLDGQEWLAPLLATAAEDPGGPDAVRLGIAFDALIQRLKHGLSEAGVVRDRLTAHTPYYQLTRAEFEQVVARLLASTVGCCEHLLRSAKVTPGALDAVLLTGGGARIPAVVQQLTQAFGRQPYLLGDPELTVVYGGSRWLSRFWRRDVPAERLPGNSVPLAFRIPGGRARLVRWLVAPGDRYPAGATLARVRVDSGALWDLTAAVAGTIDRLLVEADTDVATDQWLALALQ
jgi:molecular chaperone DnaK (HSP70)